jgi:hypothetical protein
MTAGVANTENVFFGSGGNTNQSAESGDLFGGFLNSIQKAVFGNEEQVKPKVKRELPITEEKKVSHEDDFFETI